jgi:hypothetical protein
MPAQTTNLFLLKDLDDKSRTSMLADSDLDSLRTLTDWINAFITQPHKELGRSGPVCPFVSGSLERRALWLAPEHLANQSVADLVQLVNDSCALSRVVPTTRSTKRSSSYSPMCQQIAPTMT